MARTSLSNSSSNLNLSRNKTIWLQNTVKAGNSMAALLRQISMQSDEGLMLAERWYHLMDELVEMML